MSARKPTVAQRRRQAVVSAVALVVIGLVVVATWLINRSDDSSCATHSASSTSSTAKPSSKKQSGTASQGGTASRTTVAPTAAASVPAQVTKTLSLIDAGKWPPDDASGTKGGTNFGNFEGRLPKKTSSGKRITYTEWDVNRREAGRSRDAERIVTGSDGSAWYTADHYNTFVQIRGPDR
ncbi:MULTISPECIES: ribonuclease domain-containing protein [unclassified Gordonia (in: high G+C Gram-positive bacteria)]|uniref:ribonuclease domain-containing protein n=1 Tax=unclassified Gordonia (in: high G+C Gram-positive bacteria) TaxID=2657482 RepID=UPI0007EBFB90|nr:MULTISPECIES: ribonuclease domain-containing protein [unclassified Gordonia (in: high G+C Gram-positive bacteria)]OBB99605.1 ribonuclease N [Gordonia sp. 852002-50395_SCH5434458]OBC13922.1 ribonuclease N [Gordonia sp. 852002-50816_SCH5313054-c]OBC16230.1 ribonuclease N [Gordonia sp. 852002-50816_SCH5313054-a]